jgi:hypothetical protein
MASFRRVWVAAGKGLLIAARRQVAGNGSADVSDADDCSRHFTSP